MNIPVITSLVAFALLAACDVHTEPEPPDERPIEAPEKSEEDQHFCCESLGGNGSGNGCITIDKSHIGACDKLLYCGGTYEKDGGKVTCIG